MPAFRTEDWIPLLHHLAHAADGVAMRHFGSPALSVTRKVDGSPATNADLEIERNAVTLARTLVPGIGVLGEEYGVQPGCGDTRLIVDPIDATYNFIRGNPVFATLLAVEVGGHLIAGLVSAPALRQRWWASRGNGAFRDGQRLHVSARGRLGESRLYHGTPTASRALARYPGMTALLHDSRSAIDVGDFLQHMRVAEGAAEAAIDLEVEPWDVAALRIIVEEAGGTATAVDGSDRLDAGTLLSTNGRIHRDVLSYFEPAFTDTATYLRAANAASA
jgi:histidinol-phosphatase